MTDQLNSVQKMLAERAQGTSEVATTNNPSANEIVEMQIKNFIRNIPGVGTIYQNKMTAASVVIAGGCSSCEGLLVLMNEKGADWCEEKSDEIVDATIANAKEPDQARWNKILLRGSQTISFLRGKQPDEMIKTFLQWALSSAIAEHRSAVDAMLVRGDAMRVQHEEAEKQRQENAKRIAEQQAAGGQGQAGQLGGFYKAPDEKEGSRESAK